MSEIRILYENRANEGLIAGWGFAASVRIGETRILFDVGADKMVLEHNAEAVGVDLESTDVLVLSHEHCDHLGAVSAAFHKGLRVYVPHAFARRFRFSTSSGMMSYPVKKPIEIAPGIMSIGQHGRKIPEQAILVHGKDGPVLVTGCAHPGIVKLARKATELAGKPLHLALGGFHLFRDEEDQVRTIARELTELGVQRIAPCHCTGEKAMLVLKETFADRFTEIRAGSTINV